MAKRKTVKQENDMFTAFVSSQMNTECVKEFKFHPKRKWRFDYAIIDYRIAIEVEGGVYSRGRHVRPIGFIHDMEKYNTATMLGWKVFRVTPQNLISDSTIKMLQYAAYGVKLAKDPTKEKKIQ